MSTPLRDTALESLERGESVLEHQGEFFSQFSL